VPEKFLPSLLSPNISLFSQLQSITADQDRLSLTASVEWTESAELNGPNFNETFQLPVPDSLPTSTNSTHTNQLTQPPTATTEVHSSQTITNDSTGVLERSEVWVEDRVINELLERFNWQQEWIDERIPMESPKLPQSTSAFLSALCSNCYFVLRVKGKGVPSVTTWSNGSLVLRKGDQIHMKVWERDF